MKELEFLEHWINEHYLNKRFSIRPIQRCFSNYDKNYQNNVIYFGCFSGDVIVHTPFQVQPLNLKDTHSRYFIFSHLSQTSNVDHTFIGYEITFLDLFIQHDLNSLTQPQETVLANFIYVRLGGCGIMNTNLFTMWHKNGVIYNDEACILPFNGVNETYSFSYDLQHFYSCNINSSGQITNYLLCELVVPPSEEFYTIPVSYWQAVHPLQHSAVDSVTYIDVNGIQQIQILERLEESENNPCTKITGTVLSHYGAVPCQVLPVLNEVLNGELNFNLPSGKLFSDYMIHYISPYSNTYDFELQGFNQNVYFITTGLVYIYLKSDNLIRSNTVQGTLGPGGL